MAAYFNTPRKIIITDADTPEQESIIEKCLLAGCEVTLFADTLTEELALFAKLSFVQIRIGQKYIPVTDPDSAIVITKELSAVAKQSCYLNYIVG